MGQIWLCTQLCVGRCRELPKVFSIEFLNSSSADEKMKFLLCGKQKKKKKWGGGGITDICFITTYLCDLNSMEQTPVKRTVMVLLLWTWYVMEIRM
jgi:hypothetical protein